MFASEFLYLRWYRSHLDVLQFLPDSKETIHRESGVRLSKTDFIERYEQMRMPVIISDIPEFEAGNLLD